MTAPGRDHAPGLTTTAVVPQGHWTPCDSPMKAIRDNPELLERFTVRLAEVVRREQLADEIAGWFGRPT